MITIRTSEVISHPSVSVRSSAELTAGEQEFYFGSMVPVGVSGLVFVATGRADDAFAFFYKHLKDWASRSGLNLYFLRVGSDVSKKSGLRTKMGLRKDVAIAHRSNALKFEVDGPDETSRLAVIGPLNEDAAFGSFEVLLNWMYSIVVVSELEVSHVARRAEAWVSTDQSSFLSFNFLRILDDIRSDSASIVCRFFPEDNGKPAALSMVFEATALNS